MSEIALVIHNVRSCHNVGSMLRTADGLGVARVFLTGYTPYPKSENDSRLPHEAEKVSRQIHKTSLGAENSVDWHYINNINEVIKDLKKQGYKIGALEQSPSSIMLND
jgi:23S rRNA (guanosine2251-2'-O)-methyltransferase